MPEVLDCRCTGTGCHRPSHRAPPIEGYNGGVMVGGLLGEEEGKGVVGGVGNIVWVRGCFFRRALIAERSAKKEL